MSKKVRKAAKIKSSTPDATASATPQNRMVAEHLAASDRVMKKVLSSKKNSIAFLVEAGILSKNGKGLAKPYR